MKLNSWVESENNNGKVKMNEFVEKSEAKESNCFYGRTYNESVPFTQTNFDSLQSLLDQRNQLLGSVKSYDLM
ncbi:hypothetical protein [Adhaeribacter aquaticus]|uniref:hypothetical protein n=1 Tax=Adhaeribacter aquaticus TaxID=299567 RepID=UPI00040790D9|nr:hypothetical protein [Adhaeribacter aquaticus]